MTSNYNSRYKPPEILVINNEVIERRKRETIEDLMKNQIELDFSIIN